MGLLDAEQPDATPVERVRRAFRVTDDLSQDERNLKESLAALRSLPDIYEALQLQEWRAGDESSSLSLMLRKQRELLIERFREEFRRIVREGQPASRQAAIALLGTGRWEGAMIGRALTADLIELTKNKDQAAREQAARCLGKVFPDPKVAIPPLEAMLMSASMPERRAAAQALEDLVRGASWQEQTDRGRLLRMASAVVPVAGSALGDRDGDVRKSAAASLASTAELAARAVPNRLEEIPYENRDPEKEFQEARREVRPLAESLDKQTAKLILLLKDKDRGVCLAADRALEAMAETRSRLLQRCAEFPAARVGAKKEQPFTDPFQSLLQAAGPVAKQLSDQDVRVRLAALYVLETLESEAAPAARAVIKSLQDSDPFVRWAAVRTLGKMAPVEAEKAVPVLAGLLNDPNGDVQVTTLAALVRFGAAAKPAVATLRDAVKRKDAAWRVQVINALGSIGKDAAAAIPELIVGLTAREPEIRTAAARALGKIGPHSAESEQALRKALDDSDPEVRQAASEAILK
jgi:HEAT repeat protein